MNKKPEVLKENKKPKTLKNLEEYFQIKNGDIEGKYKIVISEELKKVAISWLYYMVKKRRNPFKAFMEFHNITEKDLEENETNKK